ncbi:Peptidase S59, nucleoporin [Heracleum sosnowskyi]|uniref:Peptidase S59, nucleoporin n=1 Tax=Heracleum sosnowskyi TaxID=360622 RepID=A0AAD8MHY8_9APIA|nr:Peptidase S59, nucleoporin [Heracleum sosnowskyi]
MFSSTPSTSSFTNGFGFGQSINPNVSSTGSSGSQYTFGPASNLFGSAPNSGGTSTGLFGGSSFGQSSNLFGSAPNNGGVSTGVFGGSSFGQSSNLFGSAPNNGGTPTGVFGGSSFGQSSNLFGSALNNSGTSTGVFGGSLFGQSSNLSGSAPSSDEKSKGVFGLTVSNSSFGQSNSIFGRVPNNGGTSTGVFGQTPSSIPFGQSSNLFSSGGTSKGVFGQTVSSNSFGQSNGIFGSFPNNGETSTGVFGQTPSSIPFGKSSNYGGNPTGIFGQRASSSSFDQNSNIFGSLPSNGGTSAGVFGQTASSSFGQRNNIIGYVRDNGGTSMGLFGTTASSTPSGFQVGSVPASGGTSMGVFGGTVSPFSSASIATSSSPIIWSSSTGSTTFSQVPASIASTSSGFGSGCMTSSGQATVPWDKSSLSGANSFSFGTQSFGEKRGSRVTCYTKTTEVDDKGLRKMIVSISAMPAYKDKSHEELRWEDRHQFNAGGGGVVPASVQSNDSKNPFARTDDTFQSPIPPFISSNLFPITVTPPSLGQHSFPNPATPSVPSNPFAAAVTSPSIGQYPSVYPVPPSAPSNPFSTTVTTPDATKPFIAPFSPMVSPNPFLNNSSSAPSTSETQPVSIFEPNKSLFISGLTTPTAPQYPSNNSSSTGAAPIVGPSYTNSFASSSYMWSSVAAPVTVSVPCTASIKTASLPAPFWPSQTSQTGGLSIGGFDGSKGVSGQSTLVQQLPSQNTEVKQSPIPSPFGTPSAVPQMLTAPPVRYGISSITVCDKPAPARSPSLLNIRHLSYHRQRWLPIQKYNPKIDGPKVAFFDDAQKTATTAKKEATLLPRSNPRAFISGHYEELNPRVNSNNTSFEKNSSTDTHENGEVELSSAPDQDGSLNQDKYGISSETDAAEHNRNTDFVHGDQPIKKEMSLNVYELMPKLKHSDYFFEPRVEELAIKESYEPGFCSHVKGFVVGRQGYGSIKFLEETDVRELDLESYIQFRNREVIVYMDESKKPPVGQGLNKAAEITLCNIKVVDRKTGKQYVHGPNVDKFKEKLMKKTAEQGAEFVSYNAVQGEWKFRVQHF